MLYECFTVFWFVRGGGGGFTKAFHRFVVILLYVLKYIFFGIKFIVLVCTGVCFERESKKLHGENARRLRGLGQSYVWYRISLCGGPLYLSCCLKGLVYYVSCCGLEEGALGHEDGRGGGARVHQHLFVNIIVVGSSIYSI